MLSPTHLHNPPRSDLEAQIREIAAREGVALARTNPRAFTSIAIASCSTSPPPSATPAPESLHLSALCASSADFVALPTEPSSPLCQGKPSLSSQQRQGIQSRHEDPGTQQGALTQAGGHEGTPACGWHEGEEVAAPSTPESAARSGHVSQVQLTLSPKSSSHSLRPLTSSPSWTSGSALAPKELLPVRHRLSASSPGEGLGLASPPERERTWEPARPQQREDPRALHRTSDRLLTASHRTVDTPRPQTAEAPAKPSLEHGCRFGWFVYFVLKKKKSIQLRSGAVFILKHCRFCGLTNQKAARSCFTSLRGKLRQHPLTPPWRAPIQVCSEACCPQAYRTHFLSFLVKVKSVEGKMFAMSENGRVYSVEL